MPAERVSSTWISAADEDEKSEALLECLVGDGYTITLTDTQDAQS